MAVGSVAKMSNDTSQPSSAANDTCAGTSYYADNISFDFDGLLDHAPTTSHGTYLNGSKEGLEFLEKYEDGGYHPVHLGDCFGLSGCYRVLHKLGHGGFGTVWLCRDTVSSSYIALKVMVGSVDADKASDLALERLDQSIAGADHVAIPLDHFSVKGPNGTHQCIVLPVLGPRVPPELWARMKEDPGHLLRKMAYQATQALSFLHKN